MSLFEFL